MSTWDVKMIRQLYRLNMKVLDKRSKDPAKPTVEVTDGGAVAGLFRGMGTKKAKK